MSDFFKKEQDLKKIALEDNALIQYLKEKYSKDQESEKLIQKMIGQITDSRKEILHKCKKEGINQELAFECLYNAEVEIFLRSNKILVQDGHIPEQDVLNTLEYIKNKITDRNFQYV